MIQVIERVSEIMNVLAAGEATLATLATRTGVQKSTLCNILRTLQDIGYVDRAADGRYCIGRGLLDLAASAPRRDPVETVGRPVVEQLAERLGETAVVAVLRGGQRWNVVRVSSEADVVVNSQSIDKGNLYNTSTGRLLLAHADRAEFNRVIALHGLPGAAWDGIRSMAALEARLGEVRALPIVTRINDNGDVHQMAAAVVVRGRVIAAVGVAAVGSRCTGEHVQRIHGALCSAARQLGRAIESGKLSEAA